VLNVAMKTPETTLSGDRFATTLTIRAPVGSIRQTTFIARSFFRAIPSLPWTTLLTAYRDHAARRLRSVAHRTLRAFWLSASPRPLSISGYDRRNRRTGAPIHVTGNTREARSGSFARSECLAPDY
jgi:hypothetical protein